MELYFHVAARLNIVAPKPSKVFGNHAAYPSCFNIAYHTLECWTVEVPPISTVTVWNCCLTVKTETPPAKLPPLSMKLLFFRTYFE